MVMQSPFWNGYSVLRLFCGASRVSGMISNLSFCVSEHFECNLRKLILVSKVKFRDLCSTALVKAVGGISFVRLPYRFKSFGNGLEGSPGLVLKGRSPSTSFCGAIFKIRQPVLDTLYRLWILVQECVVENFMSPSGPPCRARLDLVGPILPRDGCGNNEARVRNRRIGHQLSCID